MNHENAYLRIKRQKFEARFMRKSGSSASNDLENFFVISRRQKNAKRVSTTMLDYRQIL